MPAKLIFVYNADSGLFNTLADVAHKIISPATYRCNLCALTHTPFGMKQAWREFLNSIKVPMEFLHADEWARHPGHQAAPLPAILALEESSTVVWLDAATINQCKTLAELQDRIAGKLGLA